MAIPKWHWTLQPNSDEIRKKCVKNLCVGRLGISCTKETKDKISKTKKEVQVWGGKRGKMEWMIGKNNPNWKGGITPKQAKIRQSSEYIIWRNEVYRRDYWICMLCGNKCKKDIIAHHLKSFSDFPELRFSVDNGITLCRSCHKKVHKDIGRNTRFKGRKNSKLNE